MCLVRTLCPGACDRAACLEGCGAWGLQGASLRGWSRSRCSPRDSICPVPGVVLRKALEAATQSVKHADLEIQGLERSAQTQSTVGHLRPCGIAHLLGGEGVLRVSNTCATATVRQALTRGAVGRHRLWESHGVTGHYCFASATPHCTGGASGRHGHLPWNAACPSVCPDKLCLSHCTSMVVNAPLLVSLGYSPWLLIPVGRIYSHLEGKCVR